MLAGILIGPHVLKLVGGGDGHVMHFAEFGVFTMLFLVGIEVQPALLRRMRAQLLGLGGLQIFGIALGIAGIGPAPGLGFRLSLAAGLILSMSSTAIVLFSLRERGQLIWENDAVYFNEARRQIEAFDRMFANDAAETRARTDRGWEPVPPGDSSRG